jgi:hypothetical protein
MGRLKSLVFDSDKIAPYFSADVYKLGVFNGAQPWIDQSGGAAGQIIQTLGAAYTKLPQELALADKIPATKDGNHFLEITQIATKDTEAKPVNADLGLKRVASCIQYGVLARVSGSTAPQEEGWSMFDGDVRANFCAGKVNRVPKPTKRGNDAISWVNPNEICPSEKMDDQIACSAVLGNGEFSLLSTAAGCDGIPLIELPGCYEAEVSLFAKVEDCKAERYKSFGFGFSTDMAFASLAQNSLNVDQRYLGTYATFISQCAAYKGNKCAQLGKCVSCTTVTPDPSPNQKGRDLKNLAAPGTLDLCKACRGDDTSCTGCDGVLNSGKTNDACGICLPASSTDRDKQ